MFSLDNPGFSLGSREDSMEASVPDVGILLVVTALNAMGG